MTPLFRSFACTWLLAPVLALAQPAPVACPVEPAALTPQQAQAQARDRGLLWRLTRDGRSSYLHASLHLGKPAWAAPGPRLRQALASVDAVALELDPLDPASMALPAIPPLALDAELQRGLDEQARRACIPPQALAAYPPLLQLSTFILLQSRHLGLDVRWGQEMLLSRWARERGLPVLALETMAGQLQALLPGDPDAARHDLRTTLRQMEATPRLLAGLATLVQAWERGDLDQLERYEDWCECVFDARDRATLARLNDARNPAMARRIAALHGGGQTLLVAVGALHMTGPQALPLLLRREGFTLELVHPR